MGIKEIKTAVLPVCRELDVRRLDAFGSIARGTNGPDSDLDLLVEFDDPDRQPARRFFGLLHSLEDTQDRKIDLLTLDGLRNPCVKARILEEKMPVYEA